MADGEGREGEAFYLSRKTLTTRMGGADCKREMQKVVSGGRASERAALTRQLSDVSIHSNGDAASCAVRPPVVRACGRVAMRSTRTSDASPAGAVSAAYVQNGDEFATHDIDKENHAELKVGISGDGIRAVLIKCSRYECGGSSQLRGVTGGASPRFTN